MTLDPQSILALAKQCGADICNRAPTSFTLTFNPATLATFAAALQAAQPDRERERIIELAWKVYANELHPIAMADQIAFALTAPAAPSADKSGKDARDAARYRFLRDEAYEAVIPHGGNIDGSRTAWIPKMHPGATFDSAIDLAIASMEGKP